MDYKRRIVDTELDELFDQIPALVLDGPKAVGKTTTASQRATQVLRLDDTRQANPILADPTLILRMPRPLLLDEWQKVPAVWDVVRHAADDQPIGGQFLLAGSASPRHEAPTHSGAGRIGRLRMRPMTLSERGLVTPTISLQELLSGRSTALGGDSDLRLENYVEEITKSGFPGLRGLNTRALRFQLDSYLRSAVDHDVPEQGLAVRKPETLLAWLRAYAAATSSTASYTQILDAATPGQVDKPTRATAAVYRDVLASLWLLDPVPAWTPVGNIMTRLGTTPKHHLADPALAARLLGLEVGSLLNGEGYPLRTAEGGMIGPLFESLATLCVRVAAQAAEATVGHLRTRNGDHEIDLVVVRPDGRVIAIEVKLASAVNDRSGKHLKWLRALLGDRVIDTIIINTGPYAYRRPDGIGVIPLALLGP